jgi:hypothetical protein
MKIIECQKKLIEQHGEAAAFSILLKYQQHILEQSALTSVQQNVQIINGQAQAEQI